MAFQGQLQPEKPAEATDASTCEAETNKDSEAGNAEEVNNNTEPMTNVQTITSLKAIQTLCTAQPHLIALENYLFTGLQAYQFNMN